MILSDFISRAIAQLKDASIDNSQLDARLLVCHGLRCSRVDILSQPDRLLNKDELSNLEKLISRRLNHEPVARIIGSREFWGLDFALNEATLEPRPDTETLIETILSVCHQKSLLDGTKRILDLGTGTGCILLSLLHELPQATGLGIDINPDAVLQATQNAFSLKLDKRSVFREGNWLKGINEKFDIIVSNPPYIQTSDISHLMPEVRQYDPLLALDGGEDGLKSYSLLIPQIRNMLNPSGFVAFEVGINQATAVKNLLEESAFADIKVYKDLGGIERCLLGF
jgi:release factor glutamine methyltransferase